MRFPSTSITHDTSTDSRTLIKETAHGHNVELTGKCFYYDNGDRISFLEDVTGGIRVDTTPAGDFDEGMIYTIKGQTYYDGHGVGVRIIQKSEGIKPTIDETVPELRYDLGNGWVNSHQLQYKTIKVTGVVRSASYQPGKTILRLATGEGTIKVFVQIWSAVEYFALPSQLIGARMCLQGVLAIPPPTTDQPHELELYVPSSISHIGIIKLPSRIQEIPKLTIAEILQNTKPQLLLDANIRLNAIWGVRFKSCLKIGMDDVVTKPVKIELLESKLAHWLKVSAESKWREEVFAATTMRRDNPVSHLPAIADQIAESDTPQVISN